MGPADPEERANQPGGDVGLSDREAQLLSLIARGLTDRDIAHHQYLSIHTVKTCIRTAYRKIAARNRAGAVVWAIQHGFATAEDRFANQDGLEAHDQLPREGVASSWSA